MANPGAALHEDGHTTYFCSGHCRDRFAGQARAQAARTEAASTHADP